MNFFVNLSWYLSIISLTIATGTLLFFGAMGQFPHFVEIPVPLEITFTNSDTVISAGDQSNTTLIGRGIVDFPAPKNLPPPTFRVIIMLGLLMGSMIYALHQLRLLMQTVRIGKPFHEKNPLRMRIIGFVILLWGPVKNLAIYLNAHDMVDSGRFLPKNISGVNINIAWLGQDDLMMIGIVVLVLAQIFAVGVELQRDKDLTI